MPTGVYPRKPRWIKFWENITLEGDCWAWTGRLHEAGYGLISVGYSDVRAHRFAYEEVVGKIPEGLTLDHLCRNRKCANPNHLEPVTRRINNIRGYGASGINFRKTHCIHGHEFTPDNTTISMGWRYCKTCNRKRMKDRRKAGYYAKR